MTKVIGLDIMIKIQKYKCKSCEGVYLSHSKDPNTQIIQPQFHKCPDLVKGKKNKFPRNEHRHLIEPFKEGKGRQIVK